MIPSGSGYQTLASEWGHQVLTSPHIRNQKLGTESTFGCLLDMWKTGGWEQCYAGIEAKLAQTVLTLSRENGSPSDAGSVVTGSTSAVLAAWELCTSHGHVAAAHRQV